MHPAGRAPRNNGRYLRAILRDRRGEDTIKTMRRGHGMGTWRKSREPRATTPRTTSDQRRSHTVKLSDFDTLGHFTFDEREHGGLQTPPDAPQEHPSRPPSPPVPNCKCVEILGK